MPINEPGQQLEKEISNIEEVLAAKRQELERQKEAGELPVIPHEKETLHEVIGEKLGSTSPYSSSQPATQEDTPATTPPPQMDDALSYLSEELRGKVQELVNVAFNQSLELAINQAKATNNSSLIDAFHDVLVDQLYNHLVERGKLKEF